MKSANERKTERLISWLVLLCLVAIAAAVFARQFAFNPAVLIAHQLIAASKAPSASAVELEWLPAELKPFGAAEQFTPDNLYDKIDGKAELYVSAGISEMACQRFALKDDSGEWFEWFCYGMNGVPQAFSVFSTQRRAEGQSLDFTPYAYRTQNAIFFIAGTNYVEAVGSSTSEPLLSAMIAMAKRFVTATGADAGRMPEMQILPTNDIVAGTMTLQTSDAFGFDGFKNVFTAEYKLNGADTVGFATACASPEAAQTLCDAYRAFLLANGGKETTSGDARLGNAIEIMDAFEIVFCRGNYVAGVHAAPSLAAAAQLGSTIDGRLTEKAK